MVNFQNKRIVRGLALAGVAGAIAACGGGGGGGGSGGIPGGPTTANEYEVILRAGKTELPVNLSPEAVPGRYGAPGVGLNAPFTTELYVSARRKNTKDFIPPGENVFGCRVDGGLDVGSLYYLDGDPDHEAEYTYTDENGEQQTIEIPAAYRALVLDSNAGGASFHFHAGKTAGQAVVSCSVTDPQSGKQESASIRIFVGEKTGVASQVRVNAASNSLGYVFAQNVGGATQLLLQAQVLDDTGQWAPNPPTGVNNLYARIVPTGYISDDDAKLRGTGQADNTWVKTRSINGQAQFSVISGMNPGPVFIEVIADRADNNIDNGIQQAISNYFRVDVVDGSVFLVPPEVLDSGTLAAGKEGEPYEPVVLGVRGGTPPYTWSLVDGRLPSGMTLRSYGVLDGTPLTAGSYSFVARVTDANGLRGEAAYGLMVEAAPPPVPAPEPEIAELTISGPATLADATVGLPYAQVFSATGGAEGVTHQWSAVFRKSGATISATTLGLSMSPAGALAGTPNPSMEGTYVVEVTVRRGSSVANRAFTLTIN